MTNGDVHVIVALLLMGRRTRRIEVGLHGRAEHGHKVAGVTGAVVVANRRIKDPQLRSRCNRSCTTRMRQRELSGAQGLRHGAGGSGLAAYGSQIAAVAGDLRLPGSADVHGIARPAGGDAVDQGWGMALRSAT